MSAPPTSACRSAPQPCSPDNVQQLADGLEIDADQVQLYVAIRELAHQRLFAHVPWLRSHLLAAVEDYARGITVDPEAIGRAVAQIDPTQLDPSSLDPERLADMLGADAFASPQTPEQEAALARLETTLALVEGWVDEVAMAAVAGGCPRPRRCRRRPVAAGHLAGRRSRRSPPSWAWSCARGACVTPQRSGSCCVKQRGIDGRDAVWAHPDLLPSSTDLDDPAAFVARPADGPIPWPSSRS